MVIPTMAFAELPEPQPSWEILYGDTQRIHLEGNLQGCFDEGFCEVVKAGKTYVVEAEDPASSEHAMDALHAASIGSPVQVDMIVHDDYGDVSIGGAMSAAKRRPKPADTLIQRLQGTWQGKDPELSFLRFHGLDMASLSSGGSAMHTVRYDLSTACKDQDGAQFFIKVLDAGLEDLECYRIEFLAGGHLEISTESKKVYTFGALE